MVIDRLRRGVYLTVVASMGNQKAKSEERQCLPLRRVRKKVFKQWVMKKGPAEHVGKVIEWWLCGWHI